MEMIPPGGITSRTRTRKQAAWEVAQTPRHHGCTHTSPSLPVVFGGPVWLAEEGEAWTRFMDELAYCVGASWKKAAAALLYTYSRVTLKDSLNKKNCQFFCKKKKGRRFDAGPGHSLCDGRKVKYMESWLWHMAWPTGQEFGKKKRVDNWDKEVWG